MTTSERIHSPTDFNHVRATLNYSDGRLTARAAAGDLRTVLQPIFSVRHRRPVGYEGLVRCTGPDGHDVPLWHLFGAAPTGSLLMLDRQAALLHARNFFAVSDRSHWLFLNLHPVELTAKVWGDGFFERLLHDSKVRPEQIVLEVLEEPVSSDGDLAAAIRDFRAMGVLVALDDFGAGHSNFERIWRLKPDIVKLDRSLIVQAELDRSMRRSLPSIVDILHQNGSLVVAEGIENQHQAAIALHSDVDMVQGFHFTPPFDITGAIPQCPVDWCELEGALEGHDAGAATAPSRELVSVIEHLDAAAGRCAKGEALEAIAQPLLDLEGVIRVYAIDQDGLQRCANLESALFAVTEDPRFVPLTDAEGATWRSRHYFRRAKTMPGKVHVSSEYLSCTDAVMCTTLSIGISCREGVRVLCCDIRVV